MNDPEELVELHKQRALSRSDLFIHFFRLPQRDFDQINDALPENMRADFYDWAREFCRAGGLYVMADGYEPIASEALQNYETWARAHGKW